MCDNYEIMLCDPYTGQATVEHILNYIYQSEAKVRSRRFKQQGQIKGQVNKPDYQLNVEKWLIFSVFQTTCINSNLFVRSL